MAFSIGEILGDLQDIGFFFYVVPFLIIFAIIFAILEKSGWLGDNKAVKTIVSAGVGLLAIQFGIVQEFFNIIFPRMGVGLAIILVALIFIGFFVKSDKTKELKWIGYVLAAVIIIWALMSWGSFGGYGSYSFWDILEENGIGLLAIAAFIGAFIAITGGDRPARPATP